MAGEGKILYAGIKYLKRLVAEFLGIQRSTWDIGTGTLNVRQRKSWGNRSTINFY